MPVGEVLFPPLLLKFAAGRFEGGPTVMTLRLSAGHGEFIPTKTMFNNYSVLNL
jgi:hypothetical protein